MSRSRLLSSLIISLAMVFIAGCGTSIDVEEPSRSEAGGIPSATLWADGAWALYSLNRTNTDGTTTEGTCRIAAVGKEMVDNKPYHWLEIREDSVDGVKITKFLALEDPDFSLENGFTFWDDVKQIIIQENTNTPERVPEAHLKRYAPHFVEGNVARKYGNVQNIDPPTHENLEAKVFAVNDAELVCTGVRKTSHFVSTVNLGFIHLEDTTESYVEYYSHPDVPFGGLVSVTFKNTTESENKLKPDSPPRPPQYYENQMTLQSYGLGAQSQITGQPVEMEVMPFPFLEAAMQKKNS
ncbi:MAG: hypothetical protein WBM02_11480 [bacterium]